jgi:hypothetical protein
MISVDMETKNNGILDMGGGDIPPTSSSYEYVEGSFDSPYIITSSDPDSD